MWHIPLESAGTPAPCPLTLASRLAKQRLFQMLSVSMVEAKSSGWPWALSWNKMLHAGSDIYNHSIQLIVQNHTAPLKQKGGGREAGNANLSGVQKVESRKIRLPASQWQKDSVSYLSRKKKILKELKTTRTREETALCLHFSFLPLFSNLLHPSFPLHFLSSSNSLGHMRSMSSITSPVLYFSSSYSVKTGFFLSVAGERPWLFMPGPNAQSGLNNSSVCQDHFEEKQQNLQLPRESEQEQLLEEEVVWQIMNR